MSYSPVQNFSHAQLVASSDASGHAGVPVNIVRGVTAFKYGPSATAADFSYTAGQLAGWYTHFYKQNGSALVSWQKAAAQEMPGASPVDVATATAAQSTAVTGFELAPVLTDVLGSIAGDVVDSTSTLGTVDLAGQTDTTGVTSSPGAASGPSTGAGTGTASDSTSAAGAGAGGAGAATTLLKAGGLAGLLGATGWSELLVRALEALAGAALILLGLGAITGQSDGNPLSAVKSGVGKVARI